MITLYILRTLNNSLYVGVTNNLGDRIKRHKMGEGAEFTKRNKVSKCVYTEVLNTLLEARHRETQIKGWSRLKKENLIKYGKPIFT